MQVVAQEQAAGLKFEDVTDWYLPEDAEAQDFLIYPGAVRAEGDILVHAKKLRDMVQWRQGQENDQLRDWRLEYREVAFRAHRQRTVDGIMYILRRISTELPELDDLGLPAEIRRWIESPLLAEHGGLVLVTGGPGHGKSTTCAAIVTCRVRTFGHFCLTVEDPPEFSLHGNHVTRSGKIGKIVQVPAASESFSLELKDALRCYPSNMRGSMLMVGEVRDGDTAAQLLRSAVNGQLVISTLHAADPIAALERLLALAKEAMGPEEAKSLLSHSLRGVLQQRLVAGKLAMEPLLSLNQHSSVAARIKSGSLAQLSTDVQQQATFMRNKSLLTSLAGGGSKGIN